VCYFKNEFLLLVVIVFSVVVVVVVVTHLKHKYFTGCTINVEFAVRWIIWINALTGKEIDNILWTILVTIRCSHLFQCGAV